jgi:hypothetical protein
LNSVSPGSEVRAGIPHDLLQAFQVRRGDHLMVVPGNEDQMRGQAKTLCLPARMSSPEAMKRI